MNPEARPVDSLLFALAIAAGAVLLWGPDIPENPWGWDVPKLPESPLGLELLLWPVVVAASLPFVVDLASRLHRSAWVRRALRLPDEFKPGFTVSLRMARQLAWDAAWMSLVVGGLALAAETQNEPGAYSGAILGIAITLAVIAVARTTSIPFPSIGRMFRLPLFRLLALGAVYVLLQGDLAAIHGLDNSPLFAAWAVAVGASYLSGVLRGLSFAMAEGDNRDKLGRQIAYSTMNLVAPMATAVAVAAFGWGLLSILPSVSSVLLSRWPELPVSRLSMPYLGHLHEARNWLASCLLAAGFAASLRPTTSSSSDAPYIVMLKAAAYGVTAYLGWMVGVSLAPLGHGFALLGAAGAAGLLAVGAAIVVRPLIPNGRGTFINTARWLSESTTRAFVLGASIVIYGLLVRPVLYELLLFAPVYEWLMVAMFAVFAFARMNREVRTELIRENAPPAAWNAWSGHQLITQPKSDPRMESLLSLQQRFVNTGEWAPIWKYLMALMLRNEAPLSGIPAVFAPLRRCYLEYTPRHSSSPRRLAALTNQRQAALDRAFATAETVLSSPDRGTESVSEEQLREIAQAFVEQTTGPEQLAVMLSSAYWGQGADLGVALSLWFPLMTYAEGPGSRGGIRGSLGRVRAALSRSKSARVELERRQRMVDGAFLHLAGIATNERLSVAVLQEQVTISEDRGGLKQRRLLPGAAVELLPGSGNDLWLRPAEERRSYICLGPVMRQPALSADGAPKEREKVMV